MRPQHAIRCIHAIYIYEVVHVGSYQSFIYQCPQKSTGTFFRFPMQLPKVVQSSTATTIILTVQKFSWHVNVWFVFQYFLAAVIIFVMITINAIELIAGAMMCMYHRTFTKIIHTIIIIQFFVVPTFIAIAPDDDARMIGIPFHHFFYQGCTGFGTVCLLPAGQLIQHIQAQ